MTSLTLAAETTAAPHGDPALAETPLLKHHQRAIFGRLLPNSPGGCVAAFFPFTICQLINRLGGSDVA
jgi:hypothetical protein